MTPLTITPNVLLRGFVFSVLTTLDSAGLEVLVPKEATLLAGDTARALLNYKLQLLPQHLEVCVQETAHEKNHPPAKVIDPDSMRAAFSQWGQEGYTCRKQVIRSVLSCSVVTMSGHMKKPWPKRYDYQWFRPFQNKS